LHSSQFSRLVVAVADLREAVAAQPVAAELRHPVQSPQACNR
jgi:hypothetical protein